MKYSVGDDFPEVIFNWMDDNFEVQKAGSSELFGDKKIILIGMPGAFSPTCSMMHLPSFIKSVKEFKDLGVEEIFCVLVNDVYVAKVWGESTGATKAGIKIITDPLSILAETLDMEFTVKGTGLLRRLQRFTAVIKNNKIDRLYFEKERGVCDMTSAQNVLKDLA
jgi:cytochrome c peroxidase|tara:strand:+ start:29 stop:523 length:495 start_codon:yes stop_codon:yes gene_type:complete